MASLRPSVTALVNFFEEEDSLPGMLASLRGHVDGIVLHDGSYPRFPDPSNVSRDGSHGVIEQFADENPDIDVDIIVPPEPLTQLEKRNALIQRIPPPRPGPTGKIESWGLVIDADERLVAHAQTPPERHLPDYLALVAPDPPSVFMRIVEAADPDNVDRVRGRLVRHSPALRYEYNHYTLLDGKGRSINAHYAAAMMTAYRLVNDHGTRGTARMATQSAYYGDAYAEDKRVEEPTPVAIRKVGPRPHERSKLMPVYGPNSHAGHMVEARRDIRRNGKVHRKGSRFRMSLHDAHQYALTGCVRILDGGP